MQIDILKVRAMAERLAENRERGYYDSFELVIVLRLEALCWGLVDNYE